MRRVFRFVGVDDRIVPTTMDQEYYRTEGRAKFPPIVGKLRHALKEHVPAAKRAKELVDSTLPRLMPSHRADKKDTARPDTSIPSATRLRLTELLQSDVDRLARYMPDGMEGWSVVPRDRSLR
jgi:hypothetical protein